MGFEMVVRSVAVLWLNMWLEQAGSAALDQRDMQRTSTRDKCQIVRLAER